MEPADRSDVSPGEPRGHQGHRHVTAGKGRPGDVAVFLDEGEGPLGPAAGGGVGGRPRLPAVVRDELCALGRGGEQHAGPHRRYEHVGRIAGVEHQRDDRHEMTEGGQIPEGKPQADAADHQMVTQIGQVHELAEQRLRERDGKRFRGLEAQQRMIGPHQPRVQPGGVHHAVHHHGFPIQSEEEQNGIEFAQPRPCGRCGEPTAGDGARHGRRVGADQPMDGRHGSEVQRDECGPMLAAQHRGDEGDEQQVALGRDVDQAVSTQQGHGAERGGAGWSRQAWAGRRSPGVGGRAAGFPLPGARAATGLPPRTVRRGSRADCGAGPAGRAGLDAPGPRAILRA